MICRTWRIWIERNRRKNQYCQLLQDPQTPLSMTVSWFTDRRSFFCQTYVLTHKCQLD